MTPGSLARLLEDRPGAPRRKRAALLFFLITVSADMLMIAAGLWAAVITRELAMRQGLTHSPEPGFLYSHFPVVLLYYCVTLYVAFKYVDIYRDRRFLTGNREAARVAKAILAFVLVNALLRLSVPTFFLPSSLTLALSFVFCTTFVLLGRWLVLRARRALRRGGLDVQVALIIGAGPLAQFLAAELLDTSAHGYRLVGFLSEGGKKCRVGGLRVFGGLDRLERVIRRLKVSEIFICEPAWDALRVMQLFSRVRPFETHIRLVSSLFNVVIERVKVPVDFIGSTPILDFGGGLVTAWRNCCKRAADIIISLLALLLFGWLWGLIALLIYLESGRPILYRQKRVGQGGRIFSCYKFRSMVVGAEEIQETLKDKNEVAGHMFKIRDDPRITRVGRFLRKYSLDEAPQFFNILRGDMSLIGPRPPLPREVDEYEEWHKKRLAGPMGLTGLWQVSGRNELDFADMVLLDIYYLRNYSLFLDYRIFIRTIFTVLLGQGR